MELDYGIPVFLALVRDKAIEWCWRSEFGSIIRYLIDVTRQIIGNAAYRFWISRNVVRQIIEAEVYCIWIWSEKEVANPSDQMREVWLAVCMLASTVLHIQNVCLVQCFFNLGSWVGVLERSKADPVKPNPVSQTQTGLPRRINAAAEVRVPSSCNSRGASDDDFLPSLELPMLFGDLEDFSSADINDIPRPAGSRAPLSDSGRSSTDDTEYPPPRKHVLQKLSRPTLVPILAPHDYSTRWLQSVDDFCATSDHLLRKVTMLDDSAVHSKLEALKRDMLKTSDPWLSCLERHFPTGLLIPPSADLVRSEQSMRTAIHLLEEIRVHCLYREQKIWDLIRYLILAVEERLYVVEGLNGSSRVNVVDEDNLLLGTARNPDPALGVSLSGLTNAEFLRYASWPGPSLDSRLSPFHDLIAQIPKYTPLVTVGQDQLEVFQDFEDTTADMLRNYHTRCQPTNPEEYVKQLLEIFCKLLQWGYSATSIFDEELQQRAETLAICLRAEGESIISLPTFKSPTLDENNHATQSSDERLQIWSAHLSKFSKPKAWLEYVAEMFGIPWNSGSSVLLTTRNTTLGYAFTGSTKTDNRKTSVSQSRHANAGDQPAQGTQTSNLGDPPAQRNLSGNKGQSALGNVEPEDPKSPAKDDVASPEALLPPKRTGHSGQEKAVADLRKSVSNGLLPSLTSGAGQLCGIRALVASLKARGAVEKRLTAEMVYDKLYQLPSDHKTQKREIFRDPVPTAAWANFMWAKTADFRESFGPKPNGWPGEWNSLMHPRNFTVDTLNSMLKFMHIQKGWLKTEYALGVVTGATIDVPAAVQVHGHVDPKVPIVWIYNDNARNAVAAEENSRAHEKSSSTQKAGKKQVGERFTVLNHYESFTRAPRNVHGQELARTWGLLDMQQQQDSTLR